MKTVLCYGDSLTWGFIPDGTGRHALQDRWPQVLQAELGDAVHVVSEALNGRTTAFDDHLSGFERNGAKTLGTTLGSHFPLDLIVIMLGTNDMKSFVCGNAQGAKRGIQRLIEIVRTTQYQFRAGTPQILIMAPPPLRRVEIAEYVEIFAGGIQQSQLLAGLYSEAARLAGCGFFDAGSVATASPLDGIHLDAENTRAIGKAVAPIVRQMLDSSV
ncbi:SGNH/GDSL hydrolase family protein [Phyllobacterium sp. 0TCS1.6C]|uniref:SGNH/GDSL hydrolase family protein n=1 Tax=unclassified Phyllobacterium TaxID=2638441 RepID=UPI002264397E|nr:MULTISPECIES: SGNH/GDSL hydrolase family protein [unclassified Phyllobacterium]MCX8280657.1 SGNH/GDSL hydrolase family protein [Phyllobacterium sp. 0TCS1.6C]MCX8292766.1 SGNH/GDSL hydrolase family protein [Phyllobacterium sp. 0TCS1.6A]